jgi:hypothetical protein
MNSTAKVYYTQANYYANQLVSSSQAINNYSTAVMAYAGNWAVALSLPSVFIIKPQLDLNLSGSFTGMHIPAGKPAIISAVSTPLNTFGVGSVITQIENTGNSAALFSISIAGCPGISAPSGLSYRLAEGEGEEISTGIVATNLSGTLNEQCTVVVSDLSGGGSASTGITITSGIGETILNAISRFLSSL